QVRHGMLVRPRLFHRATINQAEVVLFAQRAAKGAADAPRRSGNQDLASAHVAFSSARTILSRSSLICLPLTPERQLLATATRAARTRQSPKPRRPRSGSAPIPAAPDRFPAPP